MGMESIEELFEHELKDILGGEQSLLDALDQMAQEDSDRDIKKVRERPTGDLLEFFNIGAAQKVERYEITTYENLVDMADKLGMNDAVELLERSLQEEEATLIKLKAIASEFDVADENESEELDEEKEKSARRRDVDYNVNV